MKAQSWIGFHALVAAMTAAMAIAQTPYTLTHSLLCPPTGVQINEQIGTSVAADGGLIAVGGVESRTVKVYSATNGVLLHVLTNLHSAYGDGFGRAVAISGTRIVVGVPNAGAVGSGRAYVFDVAVSTSAPVFVLTNPLPTMTNAFGTSVGISGDRVIIGEIGFVPGGAARVYDLASASPESPVLTLTNPFPGYKYFGHAVGISGTRAVVTDHWNDTGAPNAGSAFVYDLAGPNPRVPAMTLTNPTPASFDRFGSSVAIAGTRVVVGGLGNGKGTSATGRAILFDLAGGIPTAPTAILTNPIPAPSSFFGRSVAISATHLVIGADAEEYTGRAFVFELASAASNVPLLSLTNPTPASYDYFGYSVAITGMRFVVGAPKDDAAALGAGLAYVYDMADANPGLPVAVLNDSSPAYGDQFGVTVAISGSRLAVGARDGIGSVPDIGGVYIYDLASLTSTVPTLTLSNPAATINDYFGTAIAISGDRIVVGARSSLEEVGIAHLYDLSSPVPGTSIHTFTNPSPAYQDRFGYAVAVSETRIAIGAFYDDTGATDAGSVYIYNLGGSLHLPVLTLTNPTPAATELFGGSMAISGSRLVVGADYDNASGVRAGTVYVYDLAGSNPAWPVFTLTNPTPVANERFGSKIAVSGSRVVVGVPVESTYRGIAYVYDLAGAAPTTPQFTLTNPTPAFEYFGSAVALSGPRVVVGAYWDDNGNLDGDHPGAAYVYDLGGVSPAVPVAMLKDPTPREDHFGSAVAMDGVTVVVGAPFDASVAAAKGAAYVFAPTPHLSIGPAASGSVTVSWTPTNVFGFALQYSDSLAPTNWLNAPSGAANPVTFPATTATRFHRLFKP